MTEFIIALGLSIMFVFGVQNLIENSTKKAIIEERLAILETKMYFLEKK